MPINCRVTPIRRAVAPSPDEKCRKARAVDSFLKIMRCRVGRVSVSKRLDAASAARCQRLLQPARRRAGSPCESRRTAGQGMPLAARTSATGTGSRTARNVSASVPQSDVPARDLVDPLGMILETARIKPGQRGEGFGELGELAMRRARGSMRST